MNKPRAWAEIVQDIFAIVFEILAMRKFQELLDELLQVLDLPDLLPGIDGLQSDDEVPASAPAAASPQDVMQRFGAVDVQETTPQTAKQRPHATLSSILGKR